MLPLTRVDLDVLGCETPGCKHDHSVLFLHPSCHPGAGVEVEYTKATGVLKIACNKCRRFVSSVKVANSLK